MICASNSCPPGDEAKTYSTMLSPTPSADLGESTLCDSEVLLKFAPLAGRCTMIGWDTACSDCAIWGTDGPQAVSLHCSPKKMPDVIPPWFSSPESWTSQSFFAVEAICKGQSSLEWKQKRSRVLGTKQTESINDCENDLEWSQSVNGFSYGASGFYSSPAQKPNNMFGNFWLWTK